jgi:protoporphyrinogen oxidase
VGVEQDNNSTRRKVVVIGAGPMGFACAYRLLQQGCDVTILEAGDRIGGMSASFDFDGLTIERYYHFICAPDQALFDMLEEFGIYDKLRWRETEMGFYYQGKLYRWGRPDSLLLFPGLNVGTKLRYAMHVLCAKSIKDWSALDKLEATQWIRRWLGERGYDVLWRSLFELKFYEYTQSISAAWIAARIQRVAKSRKNIFQERLGYLEGGSETFLRAFESRITSLGGKIFLKAPVQKVECKDGIVAGIQAGGEFYDVQSVYSTIPIPYVPRMVPDLSEEEKTRIGSIANIAVACVILKLSHSVSPYFWININDPEMEVPGMVEYSNLNPLEHHVLYVPYYMPKKNPKYRRPDEDFYNEVFKYLSRINQEFREDWVLAKMVSRYELAQTICTPGFYAKIPPMRTSIKGFFMADTAYYYPEDRCISESIRVGQELAALS